MTTTAPNPALVHRRRAVYRALNELRATGRKRTAVFAAIAQDLDTGPATVSWRAIVQRVIEDPTAFVPVTKVDALTGRLIEDGYLRIVTEGQIGAPRVWDLGPRIR